MNLISIAQIIITILLITTILLQQRGTTLGGAFGGESAVYHSRRGIEKYLYWATIILAILFVGIAIVNVLK